MKTRFLFLLLLFSCSGLLAQIDNYAGVGYTPRIMRSSPLMDVLQAYEGLYDSIVTPFEQVQYIHGLSAYNSLAVGIINIGTSLGVSRYTAKGEQINDQGGLATVDLNFTDITFIIDANSGVTFLDHFFAGAGAGLIYEMESISGDIVASNYWGGHYGGITSDNFVGGMLYALFLFDLGNYVLSVRPNYQTFFNDYRYDDLYAEMTKEVDMYFSRKTAFIGVDIHFNVWY